MSKTKSRIVAWLLILATVLTMVFSAFVTVSANSSITTSDSPYTNLITTLYSGTYTYQTSGKSYDYTGNRYKLSGGGYAYYTQLWNTAAISSVVTEGGSGNADLFADNFSNLTSKGKQDFLEDILTMANAITADTENGYNVGAGAPTSDTVTDFVDKIQQESGMGATLLASLLQNTKPDYVTANKIYEPFSGTVGTILGIVSIAIMALLAITMGLDLAYITIPAFQMAMGGSESTSGNGDKSKGIGKIISMEAHKAVQAAEGGQGGGGQGGSGEYKAAVGIYFKYRWKGLVMLAICLLYLVQGQIYSLIAWFIDLFSGLLGF
jgi:hypothetical protein